MKALEEQSKQKIEDDLDFLGSKKHVYFLSEININVNLIFRTIVAEMRKIDDPDEL